MENYYAEIVLLFVLVLVWILGTAITTLNSLAVRATFPSISLGGKLVLSLALTITQFRLTVSYNSIPRGSVRRFGLLF